MTVEQGFRAIVTHCLAHMQDSESGVTGRTDPESVHQMRVGMRRLRSALGLFAEWMPFPRSCGANSTGWRLSSAPPATPRFWPAARWSERPKPALRKWNGSH